MSDRTDLVGIRQQVAQAKEDAADSLKRAQIRTDVRRIDHFAGRIHAFRMIIDIIDINLGRDDQRW